MDILTLTGRGVTVTLFAPQPVPGGMEAHALLVSGPLARPRTLSAGSHKYRVPAAPAGFHLAHVTVTEVIKQ